jgi:K+-transporting ATPase ATPase A chain
MTNHAWLLFGLYLVLLLLAARPLGNYIAAVMEGGTTLASRLGGGLESLLYRLCGVRKDEEMGWLHYVLAILLFNVLGALAVYALQRLQFWLPLNPQAMANVSPDSSFNTAISFATNTNWQGYSGESTLGYLTQMLGLAVQNFLSAATGIVVVIALIRGFARHTAKTIGNAWGDLTRITLYVLLPISLVIAVFLVSQGAIQNFDAYKDVTTVDVTKYEVPKNGPDGQPLKDDKGAVVTEPAETPTQTLPMGPMASQEAIKMLGTNGGGTFNANSSHPYSNPTPLSNFVEMLAIFLIPAALCITFGRMVGDIRQGWAVLTAMTLMFVVMAVAAMSFEHQGNSLLTQLGLEPAGRQHGRQGNPLRHRRLRLFATITTPPPAARSMPCTTPSRPRRIGAPVAEHACSAKWSSAASVPASTACWCSPSWRCSSPA